ncbi:phospho-sugar mutase [Mycolicibacterium brumae]|uniref:Phospho-sugar mutase n=1 Tax=Mycolicibacterium brumae TaxID=85968 RepID=A0A2G5PEN5_9MYCO|nr:phospho-sugar mutase [Mycolicibacterium brumae]MCV7192677.1 phospho-sugar mutase [Mycolicibacterium brumae]PIB76580.1 phospho-sugar mutase [Mycolicibacterium brumae]RWA23261.1 hypothetical protein MBRU_00145 [Mycolicibacterium brumae DSM 44177]UWW08809.1 phospho-sugar mutase [Mycolicibacterium brumae]
MTDPIATAADWRRHDPDPVTRAELGALIDSARAGDPDAFAELASRFTGPLEFGTAGLRGQVGAGQSRMNTAVVIRATAGLAAYLRDRVGPDARVVLGCDARNGSAQFFDAAAEVLSGTGLTVLALPKRLPTPVTAFAVRATGADAGVMITASHNPAADNGYKVYLGGRATDADGCGAQIVGPTDAQIAALIAAAPPADEVPRSATGIVDLGAELLDAYLDRVAGYRRDPGPSPVRVVLTAMHGVGGAPALEALRRARVPDVRVVAEQFEPDPEFPTVGFPNPEEPGALDRALTLAARVGADLVIALDPDADRCSAAVPDADGRWRQLSGDQIGALLGEQAAADSSRTGDALACSVVSSTLLAKIAAAHGLASAVTLTGFKWIARTPGLRFGYEEAIGYCTDPEAVRDKDGIGAMLRLVTLVEGLGGRGLRPTDLLDELARAHGLHATAAVSLRFDDTAEIAATMARLRAAAVPELAGAAVVDREDLTQPGSGLPATDALIYRTDAGDRVIVRPSGTEPKLKCYLEVVLGCRDGTVPHAAAADRLALLEAEVRALLERR